MKYFALGIAALALLVGGLAYFKHIEFPEPQAGASSGPDHYNVEQFFGGVVYGNVYATTTSSATAIISLAEIKDKTLIVLNPNVTGNTTLTFAASSTNTSFLPRAGNTQQTCFLNGTTSAGVNYIFAGGTGTLVPVVSSSTAALSAFRLGAQKMDCFNFVRGNSTATTFDIIAALAAYQ